MSVSQIDSAGEGFLQNENNIFDAPNDAESCWHFNLILVRTFVSLVSSSLSLYGKQQFPLQSLLLPSFSNVFYKRLRGFHFGAISLKAGLFPLPAVCQGFHKVHPKRKTMLPGIFQGWSSAPGRPRAINPSLISMLSHISSAAHRAKASKWGWIFDFTLCNVMHQILPGLWRDSQRVWDVWGAAGKSVNVKEAAQHVPLREGGWSHPTENWG